MTSTRGEDVLPDTPQDPTLAEALARRAELRRKADSLRARITDNARYQEGEEPSENADALLEQAGAVLTELEGLIRRINRTNAVTDLGPDGTMTDALARRDVLRMRHSLLVATADAAAGRDDRMPRAYQARHMRSELRQIAAVPVPQLRDRADDVARELRELDTRIQRANWLTVVEE